MGHILSMFSSQKDAGHLLAGPPTSPSDVPLNLAPTLASVWDPCPKQINPVTGSKVFVHPGALCFHP